MKSLKITLSVILLISLNTISVNAIEGVPGIDYYNNQIVFSVERGITLNPVSNDVNNFVSSGSISIDELIQTYNVLELKPYYDAPLKTEIIRDVLERMYIAIIQDPEQLEEAINAFDLNNNIEFAEPFFLNYTDYVPNDPLIGSWYHLGRIEGYLAWDFIRGDSTSRAIIGIVDSGVYYDHPDLIENLWINGPEDINGDGYFTPDDINGLDDDGNGRVDDVIGWDMAMNDNDPMEPTPTHGTHVAGCATMTTDNSLGGAGIGWSARIMVVKASRDNNPSSMSHGYSGISYAADNGADVINLSWGRAGSFSQGEQNIITAAYNAGVTVVASAGNDNVSSSHWPSAYAHVLSVAATDVNDIKANFSNYGNTIDISAPGVAINSTWNHSSYTSLQGTSMSGPIVAGVACLVKSANMGWTPDQIADHLMMTADNIDDLNPNYAGQLGAGRVNAAAAIGYSLYPRLEMVDLQVTLTQDDGDNILNPSESIEIVFNLENIWEADGVNVSGVLRSGDSFIITDSTASFGTIVGNGGTGNNNSDPFAITVSDNSLVGDHELTLFLSDSNNYNSEIVITVYVSLQQLNFPVSLNDNIESPILVYDHDNDGSDEIIVSTSGGNYYSVEVNGNISPGWPQNVGGMAPGGAAVGDIDDDGDVEIVGLSKTGFVYAWESNGDLMPGFPYDAGTSTTQSTPCLADIDGNGDLEIMITGFTSRKVYVINHDGTDFPGWPFTGTGQFFCSVAAGDIDNDNVDEIIVCGFDSQVHVFNSDQSYVAGFPVDIGAVMQASPSIADIDGDGHLNIIVATFGGDVYALNHDGTILDGWPVSTSQTIKWTPSLSDIEPDGQLETIVVTNNGSLFVLNNNGSNQPGFPIDLGSSLSGSPVIGDIDGDGDNDIIVCAGDNKIYGFNYNGQALRNFPIPTVSSTSVIGSVALADLDGDGDVEIIAGTRTSNNNLEVIDYKDQLTNFDFTWPMFAKNVQRTAFYGTFITGIDDDDEILIPMNLELSQNYPNPFNMNTIIRFSLPSSGIVNLAIFDILGREIKALSSNMLSAGYHEILWNGAKNDGGEVSTGIYFYKLEYGGETITKRMTLLK